MEDSTTRRSAGNTGRVLDWFDTLCRIPRPSKKEGLVGTWLKNMASEHGWQSKSDHAGNIVIGVPGSAGREHDPVIVIQGHQDMVCEKTPDSQHDFEKDPIETKVDGEWLTAVGTTLGADNGIAIALAIALAEDSTLSHPPLELLFTVDEETGLTGASQLDPSLITGKKLINVDSEDEGVLTVGCAGGTDTRIKRTDKLHPVPSKYTTFRITVAGLLGGHSGVDILEKRANANVVLGRALRAVGLNGSFVVAEIHGGSAHNAIPRDAYAVIATDIGTGSIDAIIEEVRSEVLSEYGAYETEFALTVTQNEPVSEACAPEVAQVYAGLLCALPHGVQAMSPDIAGLAETSANLATVVCENGRLEVSLSQRSSVDAAMRAITERIHAVAALSGATVEDRNSYPGWKPDMDSGLLKLCSRVYKNEFGDEPVVEAIHAGLECGVIGSKFEGMDMISMGPTIESPHSPKERLHIGSVGRIYRFLTAILAEVE